MHIAPPELDSTPDGHIVTYRIDDAELTFRLPVAFAPRGVVDAGFREPRERGAGPGEEVARRLLNSRRAAETLGLFGTPGLTWGKTLVIGAIDRATLDEVLTLSSSC